LHLFGGVGLTSLTAGVVISLYFGIQWAFGIPLRLRPVLVFSWVLIVVGIQLLLLGLIGEMIAHADRDRRGIYEIKRKIG
jgi:hypothetical protein